MFQGQIGVNGLVAYTPWIPREALSAVFLVEVITRSAGTLTVQIQHKNASQQDDASGLDLGSSFSANPTSPPHVFESALLTGIKELVRFKFSVGGSDDADWTCFRDLSIAWVRD